ncbi:QueT transporter family protein [Kroppenstedtia pulmonis]|uniref:QueT transporter family protein n=1 Tax=Kroppenstedtia pulmonis TaxID=1380685 RepID=A0A7D4BIJ6_9BACL|nr:QueT transporter family protein [Kroppenstedtia pulmonis]QKG83670.1 QueT transporter family protein [Kroppenstedtia pulmonis]
MPARKITAIAMIAAVYAAITLAVAPISYGLVQFRISEIMTVLPFITPLAIPGLFLGALTSNLFSPVGFYDVLFGSLASLIAAWLTSKMPNRWLAPLPPVLVNALIIGILLGTVSGLQIAIPVAMLYVGIGQLIVCYGLGIPFLLLLQRYGNRLPRKPL